MLENSIENETNEVINFDLLTYKDIKILTNYLSEQGKILPRRVTGLTSKQQKKVTKLIKTARIAALLPFVIGKIAIAYTVWSKKKGGGKLIVKEVFKKIKKSNHLNRLVTLSPLTEMATKFHTRNGAKLLQTNKTTQNFEYKIL